MLEEQRWEFVLPPFKRFLLTAANGGIRSDDPRSPDLALVRRIQTLNVYTMFHLTIAVPLSLYHVAIGNWRDLIGQGAWILSLLAGAFYLRRGRNPIHIAVGQIIGLVTLEIIGILHTGGLQSPLLFVFPVVIAYAGLVIGVTAASATTLLLTLCLCGVYFLQRHGLVMTNTVRVDARESCGVNHARVCHGLGAGHRVGVSARPTRQRTDATLDDA